ncbi:unnamed protein product [Clonostachys solani]|uniref:Uncharacterized protein n=1 Tax=Clonostachys solani TaxID=160281 RepID=A0A9N9Z5L5_9HYPO|nr:unnamed protein product [Clonostachys solani]
MDSIATELAETIQVASINRHPDPRRDHAPATAADEREPVVLGSTKHGYDGLDEEEDEVEDIPYSVLRPIPRSHELPPLPDLRFEQSYLRSISSADTWWKVAAITTRDQYKACSTISFSAAGNSGTGMRGITAMVLVPV